MTIRVSKIIEFLESAYDGRDEDGPWRARTLDAAMAIVGASSGAWFDFRASGDVDGLFQLHSLLPRASWGPHIRVEASSASAWKALPPGDLAKLFGRSLARTFRSLIAPRMPAEIPAWREVWTAPLVDNLGIVAREPDGDGCLIVTGLESTLCTSSREARLLDRLSFHFASATRLRRSQGSSALHSADAVMTPNGKLLHANPPAIAERATIDAGRQQRSQATHAPEAALDVWQGLISGRWSLIDYFDTDGKRFVLAMRNAPKVNGHAHLSPRENHACALAAMGHRDKEIAYMLGLSLASVVASLHRARRKLGAKSRSELVSVWRRSATAQRQSEGKEMTTER